MWKLGPAMAIRGKGKGGDRDSEDDGGPGSLVAMARSLAEIVTEHGLSELIVDAKDVTLTVRRGVTGSPVQMAHPQVQQMVHAAEPKLAVVDDTAHVVTSPFVGTFYRKPNPDSPNYVSLNDKIDKGAVLCIIEAMKLMNEIEADVPGIVVGILVEDGSPVEYGQPLFRIAT